MDVATDQQVNETVNLIQNIESFVFLVNRLHHETTRGREGNERTMDLSVAVGQRSFSGPSDKPFNHLRPRKDKGNCSFGC